MSRELMAMSLLRTRFSAAIALILVISNFSGVTLANASTNSRIRPTPVSFSIQEGNSATTAITLNNAIICPGGTPICQVSLSFTSSDPSLVTFSPSSLTWAQSEWFETRTLTISVLADQIYRGAQNISVTSQANTASTYYEVAIVSISITTVEIDPSPAVVAAQAEAARKAKEQKELMEILAIIPSIGQLTLSLGETTQSLYSTKCVKGKTTKYVKYGAKCPKGYKKK